MRVHRLIPCAGRRRHAAVNARDPHPFTKRTTATAWLNRGAFLETAASHSGARQCQTEPDVVPPCRAQSRGCEPRQGSCRASGPDPSPAPCHPGIRGAPRRRAATVTACRIRRRPFDSADQRWAVDWFRVTAARMSVFNASSSIVSPSRTSMARLVFPSRLALKRPAGSGKAAPLANVIFTTFL